MEKAFRALPRSDSRNVDIFGENWVRQLGRRLNPGRGRELVSAPRAVGKASYFGLNWALIAVTVCRVRGVRAFVTPINARLIYRNEILIAATCCGVRREQCKRRQLNG
jgi:hypothetical protein